MEDLVQVSIIVPVFNAKETLKKCVERIVEQSEKRIQIILVDDYSSDDSLQVCYELAKKDNRIEVYGQSSNRGPSAARNIGLSYAKGKYIYFCDADDQMDSDCIEFLEDVMEQNSADLAVCGYYIDGTKVLERNKTPDVLTAHQAAYMVAGAGNYQAKGYLWNKMFKRNIILRGGVTFDETLFVCEDALFCQEYIRLCRRIAYDATAKYNYISQPNSAMRGKVSKRNLSVLQGYDKIICCCQEYNDCNLTNILDANKMVHYSTLLVRIIKNYDKEQKRLGQCVCEFVERDSHKMLKNKHFTLKRKLICLFSVVYLRLLKIITKE